jgi:hypothetical protein
MGLAVVRSLGASRRLDTTQEREDAVSLFGEAGCRDTREQTDVDEPTVRRLDVPLALPPCPTLDLSAVAGTPGRTRSYGFGQLVLGPYRADIGTCTPRTARRLA